MPRYEFSEGNSNKFWEIELDGSSFTTTYGKIGTDGQSTEKSFASAAEARKAYDKLIAEKVKKGYELVEGGDEDGDDEGDDDEAGESGKSNPELEKAILKDPEAKSAYLVYADWLQAQGDPRGELIALSIAGKTDALQKLIDQHGDTLIGGLKDLETTNDKPSYTWRWGFIHKLHLARGYDESLEVDGEELEDLGAALSYVLEHPAGRFISEITIGVNNGDGEAEYDDVVEALSKKPLPALRKLHLSDFEYPDEIEMSWTHLGDLSGLWARMPNLQELIIQGGDFTLGNINLPELRSAAFRTGGLSREALEAISKARWPKLERLEIWLGDDNYGGDCTIQDLQPILEGKNLPKLKHLGLMNSQFSDDIARALGKSKILRQLESLDLSMGTLSDEGARAMLAEQAAFSHLAEIDVEECYLADELESFGKLARTVTGLENQREGDDGDRYVSVGE